MEPDRARATLVAPGDASGARTRSRRHGYRPPGVFSRGVGTPQQADAIRDGSELLEVGVDEPGDIGELALGDRMGDVVGSLLKCAVRRKPLGRLLDSVSRNHRVANAASPKHGRAE